MKSRNIRILPTSPKSDNLSHHLPQYFSQKLRQDVLRLYFVLTSNTRQQTIGNEVSHIPQIIILRLSFKDYPS